MTQQSIPYKENIYKYFLSNKENNKE